MDKFEYKVRSEEIVELVEKQDYKHAAEIADTIDWRRVKSVRMLCTISDVYKMVRRYEDSRALLLLAYEKKAGSRMIVYALTELCLKLGDIVNAWEYYKEFCQLAPKDTRRYILLYKVYVAQEVSLDEQIKVLEKLKEEEYTDRWAYELAYLYHRIGFATKCVEECDEMILWFGEGRFVRKAMELKMLHEPLTPKQQSIYNGEVANEVENGHTKVIPDLATAMTKEVTELDPSTAPTIQLPVNDIGDIQVKTMDDSPYNTINLQKALAESMAEIMGPDNQPLWQGTEGEIPAVQEEQYDSDETGDETDEVSIAPLIDTGELPGAGQEDLVLQQLMAPMLEETQEMPQIPDAEEIFFEDPNTTDMEAVVKTLGQSDSDMTEITHPEEEKPEHKDESQEDILPEETDRPQHLGPTYEEESSESGVKKVIVPTNPETIFKVSAYQEPGMNPTEFATHKSSFDNMLSQESDGQISLVIPESTKLEKQITGQLNIQDILKEWENWKREKEEQLKEDVKQRVLDQTGELFVEFDQATKEGLLEQLQKASVAAEAAEKAAFEQSDATWQEQEQEETVQEEVPAEESTDSTDFEPIEQDKLLERALSLEEKELFGSYVQDKRAKEKLLQMLDNMSLAAYTGNVLITGEKDAGAMTFAKNIIKNLQATDSNFSGKAAKISGEALNKKDMAGILEKLQNGALIVDQAGGINCSTAQALVKALQSENKGILILLVDTKTAINGLLKVNQVLLDSFNTRFDIEALNNDALVAFGKKYAYEREYAIDEMGALALHTRIADMQTLTHAVTIAEVKDLIKEAIWHANRKTLKHFFDVLLGKRYDKEDMIVLREEDFLE